MVGNLRAEPSVFVGAAKLVSAWGTVAESCFSFRILASSVSGTAIPSMEGVLGIVSLPLPAGISTGNGVAADDGVCNGIASVGNFLAS